MTDILIDVFYASVLRTDAAVINDYCCCCCCCCKVYSLRIRDHNIRSQPATAH